MSAPAEAPAPPARRTVVVVAVAGALVGTLVTWPGWATPAFMVAGAAVGALAVHDAATATIPNRILYPAAGVTAALLMCAAVVDGGPWARALSAAVAAFALLLAVALVAPAGMGMGDVKLAALVGLVLGWTGWGALWAALVLAFVANAVAGFVVRCRTGERVVPLAPFLAASSAVVLLVGSWSAGWS